MDAPLPLQVRSLDRGASSHGVLGTGGPLFSLLRSDSEGVGLSEDVGILTSDQVRPRGRDAAALEIRPGAVSGIAVANTAQATAAAPPRVKKTVR